ncbi:MAG: NADH-quinone oxidoreductase subunit NuoG [Limnochordales bacterium]|nr:NADH dehydrogenase (quinone) subunit G [Bacillota bacterium]REJ37392.1 MAG: NADH dehydrogenase (quinone) subunit G [Bacillota bacterium]
MSDMVTLTIDGRQVQVPKGMGLVEAAALAGVEIPVFCHHPKLEPVGVCRMCLVEVEGQRKPVPACTTKAAEGMVVKTDTPLIRHLRQGVIEFLLLNHPLDCPVCDKGGECPLQDNTFKYGLPTSRLTVPKMRKRKAVDLGNFIILDEERCILCRRCVRFDKEIALEGNLVVVERAHENLISTATGEAYDSYFSGNTIELCPVGALTSKNYRFKGRPWDMSPAPSICTACPVGCNVRLDFRFGELARVVSREHPDVDGGWLCDRGRFNYKYVNEENRITQPLMRRGDQLVPVSWTEALMEIANRFRTITRDHGAGAIGFIGGGRLTNEEAYLFQKLARDVVGTPHVDHRVGRQQVASWDKYGGRLVDLDDADVILVVDVLPAERMPVADLRIRRAAQRRGAALLTIGARQQEYLVPHTRVPLLPAETAAALRQAAAVLAGGDGKLGAAAPLVEALRQGRKVVVVWGGEDLAVGQALAELLQAFVAQGGERSVRVLIPGEQANSRGAEAMGVRPDLLPGHRPVAQDQAGMDTGRMLQAAAAGTLQALYIVGANVAETYPHGVLVNKALSQVPFLVVQDMFLTETARFADVVLPAAPFAAKRGTYTNMEGRVQEVDPAMPPGGESRTDGDIFLAIAEAMGKKLIPSRREFRQEMERLLGELAADGFLAGAPWPAEAPAPAAAADGGLVLLAVDRLYGGGGTARFDPGFRSVQPKAEALFHPADAAALGLNAGDTVTLQTAGGALSLPVRISAAVVPGTVQVPWGAPDGAVNSLLEGALWAKVHVRKRVLEEVG